MAFQQFSLFARKNVFPVFSRHINIAHNPLLIQATPIRWAEPLKKKKRLDPAVIRAREERRKKKMEKQIRRLEKNQMQLKPIDEVEVPLELLDDRANRKRFVKLSPEREEEIALMKKEWSRYMHQQFIRDSQILERIAASQEKALKELRLESEELYQAAVKIDENLLPFTFEGPVDTPPVAKYPNPDGEYIDISKKWK